MRPRVDTTEDVLRLRQHARNLRTASRHPRTRQREQQRDDSVDHRTAHLTAVAALHALRIPMARLGPRRPHYDGGTRERVTGSAAPDALAIRGLMIPMSKAQPIVARYLEEHLPLDKRSPGARAFARALRYTCAACAARYPNAHAHSHCAHLHTPDVLASRTHVARMFEELRPLAVNLR